MPKNDSWPGGTGLETITSMDSAGSCDSAVSAKSGFSGDSLEHLSIEEKACLMFLEETIESLDTEEDSGLSSDKPDQLPRPGNLAAKLADLSASMSKDMLNDSLKHALKEPIKENADTKPMQSYRVPTPLVVAGSPPCSVPSIKPGVPPDKPQVTPSSNKLGHKYSQKPAAPPVPLEVNVVIAPHTKPRDYSVMTPQAPLSRGPLSYEALVHLQQSASTKKTPLCPTVDHTIDLDMSLPVPVEGQNLANLPRSDKSHSEAPKCRTAPPVVAPKPKKIPANISVKTCNEALISPDSSYSVKYAPDTRVVRLEALKKLGLLTEQPENETVASVSPPKSHTSLDPTSRAFKRRGPSNVNTSTTPSLHPEPRNRFLQSSASSHHYSRHEQQPASVSHPAQSSGMKIAGLRCSAPPDNHTTGNNSPEPQHMTASEPVKSTTTPPPVPHKPSNSVEYTVMVVPRTGADRKEALRKLGLLKDKEVKSRSLPA
uniref:Specifically androgen-regulated gene protein n=1 Tax=Monopterus albus TaxID=43700 RepID=A0A3Q3Q2H9_MONAL|nr:specifically androgen-regulated gene protein [Monopterus albus]